MAKKIAIEWDDQQVRMVLGRTMPSGCVVTDSVAVDIDSDKEGTQGISAAIRSGLNDLQAGKVTSLVALGRGKTEMRQLKLPQVPDDELPEMVRFQAVRDFAGGEASIVDFYPAASRDDQVDVIAAALSPSQKQTVDDVLQGCGLTMDRLALRPLAAAHLYHHRNEKGATDCILLDMVGADADLVVMCGGKPVFLRSFRLPGDHDSAEQRTKALVGELKRSLLAARSAMGSSPPKQVVIWGEASVHSDQAAEIRRAMDLDVEVVSPFDLVSTEGQAATERPEHSGRLAPLIGLLDADESDQSLLIDFENPRRPAPPKSHKDRLLLYGIAGVAAVLLLGYLAYSQFTKLDQKIVSLQSQLTSKKTPLKEADVSVARTEIVDKFLDGNVIWLDELKHVANGIPASDEAILTSIDASTDGRNGGGTLTVTGSVVDVDLLAEIESGLRDEMHVVSSAGSTSSRRKDQYRQSFVEKIVVPGTAMRELRAEAEIAAREANGKPESVKEPLPQEAGAGQEIMPEAEDVSEPEIAEFSEPGSDVAGSEEPNGMAESMDASDVAKMPAGASSSEQTSAEDGSDPAEDAKEDDEDKKSSEEPRFESISDEISTSKTPSVEEGEQGEAASQVKVKA